MNARQKVKELKKEIEYYKKLTIKIDKVVNYKLNHLRSYCSVRLEDIDRYGNEMMENEARIQLSWDIMNNIRDNIKINKNEDGFGYMRYSTDIMISFGDE